MYCDTRCMRECAKVGSCVRSWEECVVFNHRRMTAGDGWSMERCRRVFGNRTWQRDKRHVLLPMLNLNHGVEPLSGITIRDFWTIGRIDLQLADGPLELPALRWNGPELKIALLHSTRKTKQSSAGTTKDDTNGISYGSKSIQLCYYNPVADTVSGRDENGSCRNELVNGRRHSRCVVFGPRGDKKSGDNV